LLDRAGRATACNPCGIAWNSIYQRVVSEDARRAALTEEQRADDNVKGQRAQMQETSQQRSRRIKEEMETEALRVREGEDPFDAAMRIHKSRLRKKREAQELPDGAPLPSRKRARTGDSGAPASLGLLLGMTAGPAGEMPAGAGLGAETGFFIGIVAGATNGSGGGAGGLEQGQGGGRSPSLGGMGQRQGGAAGYGGGNSDHSSQDDAADAAGSFGGAAAGAGAGVVPM
jgi:hypothetical protein